MRQLDDNQIAKGPRWSIRPVADRRAAVRRGLTFAPAAMLLSFAALAVAPLSADAQAVHACYDKQTGALRFVPSGGRCRHGEARTKWGLAGPIGVKGASGPSGPRGREGALGPNGVGGATGPSGTSIAGAPGAAGTTGASGVNGATGAAGPTGAAGSAGAPGLMGATGSTGPDGIGGGGEGGTTGATGATGAAGAPGASLPPTLPVGSSESGVWIATTTEEKPNLPPRETVAIISFPLPLSVASLAEEKVHYITKAKTTELETTAVSGANAVPGCVAASETPKAGLLEHPQAESGNLCVYAGVEELTDMKQEGITKANNALGAQRTGASVVFQVVVGGIPAHTTAQGSWAVTD